MSRVAVMLTFAIGLGLFRDLAGYGLWQGVAVGVVTAILGTWWENDKRRAK